MWEEVLKIGRYRNRIPKKARDLIDDLMLDYRWRSVNEIFQELALSEFRHLKTGQKIHEAHIRPYLNYARKPRRSQELKYEQRRAIKQQTTVGGKRFSHPNSYRLIK